MRRVIDLDQESESRLDSLIAALGMESADAALTLLTRLFLLNFTAAPSNAKADLVVELPLRVAQILLKLEHAVKPIRSTPAVMGGDACIRDTRVPVWLLVSYKGQGLSDSELLANFPDLSAADLSAAWDFYAANTEDVMAQRRRHEDAA